MLDRAVAKAERSYIALDNPRRRAFIAALVFSSSILWFAYASGRRVQPEAIRDGEGPRPLHQGGLPKQIWNDRARPNVARLQPRN